jgi:hypothetical protein
VNRLTRGLMRFDQPSKRFFNFLVPVLPCFAIWAAVPEIKWMMIMMRSLLPRHPKFVDISRKGRRGFSRVQRLAVTSLQAVFWL